MADRSNNLKAPAPDLLQDDIPVIDTDGKRLIARDSKFIELVPKAPALLHPTAVPPPNLPVVPAEGDVLSRPFVVAAPQLHKDLRIIESPIVAPTLPNVPLALVTKDDFNLDQNKDEGDIVMVETVAENKKIEHVAPKAEVLQLEDAVERAVAKSGAQLTDTDMTRRFRMLVSLYFRDLRDALETKSKFTMPVQSGGMGMSDVEADRVMTELQKNNQAYRRAHESVVENSKASYVAERTDLVLGAQDRIDQAELAKREEAFSGLVQRTGIQLPGTAMGKSVAANASAMRPIPTSTLASAAASQPHATISNSPRTIPVIALDTPSQRPTTIAAKTLAPSTTGGADLGPPTARSEASTGGAKSATGPVASQTGVSPTSMSDVAAAPRLTGPIEEIRSLTLTDFRRLSRDPREATLKIRDKIDLLEEQSFEMKTQGIRGWQESGLNAMYLDILRTSLEGKPVVDIIVEREADGKPVLTKPEFDAIMELNRALRFG